MGRTRPFHCQQFSIYQDRCAMKVGTDSILLGSWITTKNSSTILDVGTGSGILALMMAQRAVGATIDGVEIDSEAANQATENAAGSKWANRVRIYHTSLQTYSDDTAKKYDLIICNPPFFEAGDGVKSAHFQRQLARHTDTLSHNELLEGVCRLLSPNGRFCLVLPFSIAELFLERALSHKLSLVRSTAVRPYADRPPNRLMMELILGDVDSVVQDEIVIRETAQHYSQQYRDLTTPFYLAGRLR